MIAPPTVSIQETDLLPEDDELFVPHHAEERPYTFCFECHGYLIGPVERRLCNCGAPTPLPPRLAEKARVLDGVRDALAEAYRRRLFRIMLPMLDGATEEDAREAWRALWPVARTRAARCMEERGLRL